MEASVHPISDETGVANGGGRFNDFQGGSIYWSPVSGAHEVRGGLPPQLVFDSGAMEAPGSPPAEAPTSR
jgi:uncharacterized protein with LGFP repeats